MSRRIKLALVGAGIVIVGLLVFFLVINPIRGDIGQLNGQIATENDKIARLTRELQMAETVRKEGRQNQARLVELAKMIPDQPEIPSLILQLQDLADKAGIKWTQISPSDAKAVEGTSYETIPLSLSFQGNFYDVTDFIYRAEQMVAGPGRLLAVKDVSMTPSDTAGVKLGVHMTVYAFMMAPTATVPVTPATTVTSSTSSGSGSTTTIVNPQ
jgi:type IV pilus assembly protein PilO